MLDLDTITRERGKIVTTVRAASSEALRVNVRLRSFRNVVALVTVIIFAVYYHYLSQTPAALASFFTGFLLPAIAAGIFIGSAATTAGALVAYGVFSLTALLVYRFVFASISGRDIGPDVVRRPQDTAPPVPPMPPVPPRRPGEPL